MALHIFDRDGFIVHGVQIFGTTPEPDNYANAVLSTASFPLARPFALRAARPVDRTWLAISLFHSVASTKFKGDATLMVSASGFSLSHCLPLSAGEQLLRCLPSIVLSTLRPLPIPRCRTVPKKKKKKCYFN